MPDRPPPVLSGERVALAPLCRADAPLYAVWINDPDVKGGFMDNGLYTTEDEERFIDRLQADAAQTDPTGVRFAILDLATMEPIGLTGLFDISWRHRRAELAISIGPADKRGIGLGTEAVALTLRWAFEVLSLHSVWLAAMDLGQGTRCWEDAGFRPVGRRREAVLAGGRLRDEVLMDVLAPEAATPPTEPRALLREIEGVWASSSPGDALALARERWPEIADRPPTAADAETCRQAMLAAVRAGDFEEARAWRVRALLRFAAVARLDGVAAVLMTELYRALYDANGGYADGQTVDVLRSSEHAWAVLEELRPVAETAGSSRGDGPTATLIARFLHERQAHLLVLEHRYDEAIAAYDEALAHAADEPRGRLKVTAGRILAAYLRDLAAGGDAAAAAAATAELVPQAEAIGQDDLAGWARDNAAAMQAGSRRVRLYEML